MKKPRRLLFRHRFPSGERVRCSVRGLKNPPTITWETGTPGKHLQEEFRVWMDSVLHTVADHFGGGVVYNDGASAVLMIPRGNREDA